MLSSDLNTVSVNSQIVESWGVRTVDSIEGHEPVVMSPEEGHKAEKRIGAPLL